MSEFDAYNPLDRNNLGASVAEALLRQPVYPLAEIPRFEGAGDYAIYFTGDEPDYYQPISAFNKDGAFGWPIYVGMAEPKGRRKGGLGLARSAGNKLYERLRKHVTSMNQAQNLDLADFHFRALVVDDVWIPLGESLLIAKFAPVWNSLIDGFGNHNPGKGRFEGMRPRWDVMHPGRPWAEKCQPRDETAEQIIEELKAYLRTKSVPEDQKIIGTDLELDIE